MAESRKDSETTQSQAEEFSFVVSISVNPGSDVILPVHLSPETRAVPMNIRWFKGTELIYQYKNGQEITNNNYEFIRSLSIQDLERGNLSLTLRSVQESDSGEYTCQVSHNGRQKTVIVNLQVRGEKQLQREIAELQREIKKVKLEGNIRNLELEKKIMKLEMERQIMELKQEKRILELEMERQIMEQEKKIEDLERQIKELPLPTHLLHGPSSTRRGSIDGIPPRMSDDVTPNTPETDEQREIRDTMERKSSDPDTKQTGEETTATDQETSGTTSQVQQREGTPEQHNQGPRGRPRVSEDDSSKKE